MGMGSVVVVVLYRNGRTFFGLTHILRVCWEHVVKKRREEKMFTREIVKKMDYFLLSDCWKNWKKTTRKRLLWLQKENGKKITKSILIAFLFVLPFSLSFWLYTIGWDQSFSWSGSRVKSQRWKGQSLYCRVAHWDEGAESAREMLVVVWVSGRYCG